MDSGGLQNTLFYLVGFAGVGKYTVAKELAAVTGAHIVDNHYINNPIFGLIEQDGVTPLPGAVWLRTNQVLAAVLETIETLSPRHWNFIFTQELIDQPLGIAAYEILDIAKRRNSLFVPVRLVCETEEHTHRVIRPERRKRMKSIDPEDARYKSKTLEVYRPDHPNTLTLDITNRSPSRAAERILEHACSIYKPRRNPHHNQAGANA